MTALSRALYLPECSPAGFLFSKAFSKREALYYLTAYKVSANSTAFISIPTAMGKLFAYMVTSAPKNLIALIRSHEAKVMPLWGDIETPVDEVQA
jgi:hypothetical protein